MLQLIYIAGPGGWRSNCRGVGGRPTPVLRRISGKGALVNDKSLITLDSSFIHTQISHTEPDNKNDNSSLNAHRSLQLRMIVVSCRFLGDQGAELAVRSERPAELARWWRGLELSVSLLHSLEGWEQAADDEWTAPASAVTRLIVSLLLMSRGHSRFSASLPSPSVFSRVCVSMCVRTSHLKDRALLLATLPNPRKREKPCKYVAATLRTYTGLANAGAEECDAAKAPLLSVLLVTIFIGIYRGFGEKPPERKTTTLHFLIPSFPLMTDFLIECDAEFLEESLSRLHYCVSGILEQPFFYLFGLHKW